MCSIFMLVTKKKNVRQKRTQRINICIEPQSLCHNKPRVALLVLFFSSIIESPQNPPHLVTLRMRMQEPFHAIDNVNNETALAFPDRRVLVKRLLAALVLPAVGDGDRNHNDAHSRVDTKTADEVITEAHLIDVLSTRACAFSTALTTSPFV